MISGETLSMLEIRSSRLQMLWFAALVLSALTVGMAFAHTLEAPQKFGYGASRWTVLTQTLYRYFAVVGGPIEVANLVVLILLGVVVRRRRSGAALLVFAAVGCFAAALAVWAVVVQPVNAHVASWSASAVPADWRVWRGRWEYGHVGRFVLMIVGYGLLVLVTLDASPRRLLTGLAGRA